MSHEGRTKGKTPMTTPALGIRHSPRIKKPAQPEAMETASELSDSSEKMLTLKEKEKTVINLPFVYEELKLPRALYDLAASIEKSSNGKVLRNKDVLKNFEEVQQIFLGWTTPMKTPDQTSKGYERKRAQMKEELTKQQEEKAILSEEIKVRDNLIEQLKDNNRKLESDLNSHKETETPVKIEMKKQTMEIEFLETKLRRAHSEIKELKETNEENEKKFLGDPNTDERTKNEMYGIAKFKDGEETIPHEKGTRSEELLHELKTVLDTLIEEEKAHQKTKKEEKLEREELQKLKEELLYEKDTLTNELTQVRADKQQKNEELESIRNELIISSDFNERKSRECESLKDQIMQMQNELKQKKEESESIVNQLIRSSNFNERKSQECESLKDQIMQMQNELKQKTDESERMGYDQTKSSELVKRKSRECESLKDQFAQMQDELKQKSEELDDLQNRLSSCKLDGDQNMTNLGDPNRPSRLEQRYEQLYDNLWTDIFDELTDLYHDVASSAEREKMAALEIMSIFERILLFCKSLVDDQEKTIISSLTCCSEENMYANNSSIDISTIRNIRRSIAQKVLPSIVELYIRQNEQEFTGLMKDFAEECIAICWLTQVQDPPMAFEFNYNHGVQLDKDLMREFTVSGDIVDYVVWPTMRLTSDGPVMVKSVVQPIKKKR